MMTEKEIKDAVKKVPNIGAMTVNERLFLSGLMDEFDHAKINNKEYAKKILELLGVDAPSINSIVK